jgi:hypothetical protein
MSHEAYSLITAQNLRYLKIEVYIIYTCELNGAARKSCVLYNEPYN